MNDDVANRMSLFYAQPTPMLKVLSDTTTRFVSEVGPLCLLHKYVYVCTHTHTHTHMHAYISILYSALFQNKDIPLENTTDCLGTMAQICRTMIENP